MIGIVSHDLRNPLSSILMGAALLARGVSPSQDRVLAKITRATDRANALIGDLLDFTQARLGTGLPVSPESLDIHAIVADVVDELAFSHPERSLKHVRVREGECSADGNRLTQFIGNLVWNAVAYGKPNVPITVTSTIDETSFSIAVHNEGAPIPPSVQETLFLPMTRGTKSRRAAAAASVSVSSSFARSRVPTAA